MLPMALAVEEGSEQNAPLGRAVIGGLLFATLTMRRCDPRFRRERRLAVGVRPCGPAYTRIIQSG